MASNFNSVCFYTLTVSERYESGRVIPDNIEIGFKMDIKMTSYKNDRKRCYMNRQKKPGYVLMFWRNIQMRNQESDMDIFSILDF